MATLNQEILTDICFKLLKNDEFDPQCLNTFALAGKESLTAFETVISRLKGLYIDGDTFSLKFTDGDKTFYTTKPGAVVTNRLMTLIGSNTKRLSFTGVTPATAPIIDVICNTGKLTKLAYFDEILFTETENPFARIVDACFALLQKLVVPAEFYFNNNPQIFHLRSLYFKSEEDNILPYLNHPSCVATELIIELKEQEGDPVTRWQALISCFINSQNPAFANVKLLKLKLHIEQYIDATLTSLLQAVSTRFPALQTFTLINDLSLNEFCHTFQDFANHSRFYYPLHIELEDSNYNFGIDIEWNIKYNVTEELFMPHFTTVCRSIYDDYDIDIENPNAMTLIKNDELSTSKSISFEIKIVNKET